MKKWTVLLLVLCMTLALLAGCKKDEQITKEDAIQIVLDELNMTQAEANPHVHTGDHNGRVCYSVYVTVDGVSWEYKVDGQTGEILDICQSSHSH